MKLKNFYIHMKYCSGEEFCLAISADYLTINLYL